MAFTVAVPSWGLGSGGTRFARFPIAGEPRNIFEKLEDCEVVFRLTRATPGVSLHIPWDKTANLVDLRASAAGARAVLRFDEFQHLSGSAGAAAVLQVRQPQPHGCGGAAAGDRAQPRMPRHRRRPRRARAYGVDRRRRQFPGPAALPPRARSLPRQPESDLSRRCPRTGGCSSSTSSTSRPSIRPSSTTGARATTAPGSSAIARWSLVDLGHHAPNVNVELIVARLIQFGKLGGFHFNDSQYGDDDLDAGSVKPFQLFLIFNELVDAERSGVQGFSPCVHARPVAQCDRPDRIADCVGHRGDARLRAGAPRRSRGARRLSGIERSR